MKCHCSFSEEYKWDTEGATFQCEVCSDTHRMCCAVYKEFICGEVDDHEGDHVSVSTGFVWNNQVYKK